LFTNGSAIAQFEIPHTAHLIRRLIPFNAAVRHERGPVRQAVEVSNNRPHPFRRGADDAAHVDPDHDFPPFGLSALPLTSRGSMLLGPPARLLTSRPISRSSWSTTGAWAR